MKSTDPMEIEIDIISALTRVFQKLKDSTSVTTGKHPSVEEEERGGKVLANSLEVFLQKKMPNLPKG